MPNRTERRAAERAARKIASKAGRTKSMDAAAPESPVTSAAQILANQQNAKHSTGPTSAQGKAVSALNNTRHGLAADNAPAGFQVLPTEDQNAYNARLAAFQAEWKPVSATEHDLVNRLAVHQWLRLRALRLQNATFHPETGLVTDTRSFELYRRYETAHERAFNKAFSDLTRLRSLQQREQNGFESQRRKNEIHAFQIRRLQHSEGIRAIKEMAQQAVAECKSPKPDLSSAVEPGHSAGGTGRTGS